MGGKCGTYGSEEGSSRNRKREWNGMIWLRIAQSGRLIWTWRRLGVKKNARNFLSYEISASLDGLCTKELINYVSRKSEKRRAKNETERKATVMFLWYTIQLHFLRAIPYSSIKHNHVLLYCNYIFQTNITETFKISYNILQLFSLYGIQYGLQWLSQRKIYKQKIIIQNLYKTLWNRRVDVLDSGCVQIVYQKY